MQKPNRNLYYQLKSEQKNVGLDALWRSHPNKTFKHK